MERLIQITTTSKDRHFLETMGRSLVEKRLVACAQIVGPIQSIYQWKGKVEEAREWLLLMKSRDSLYQAIEDEIKERHPYEVPEIIVTPVDRGLPSYLRWVTEETLTLP